MKWRKYIVYACLMQIRFYDTFMHLYGKTHIQLCHENSNNIFTDALQLNSYTKFRSMSLFYYFYLPWGSLITDL